MYVFYAVFLFHGNPSVVEFVCRAELAGTMVHVRIYVDSGEEKTSGKSVSVCRFTKSEFTSKRSSLTHVYPST